MKKDKRYLRFLLVLFCSLAIVGYFVAEEVAKQIKENKSEPVLGIIAKLETEYDNVYNNVGDSYIVSKYGKYGVIDSNGSIIFELKYDDIDSGIDGAYILKNGKINYYVNEENKIVFETEKDMDIIRSLDNKNTYFSLRENGKTILYDMNGKEIYTLQGEVFLSISGNNIFLDNKIINMSNNETLEYVDIVGISVNDADSFYEIYKLRKGLLLYNYQTNEAAKYDKLEEYVNGYVLVKDDERLSFDLDGNITNNLNKKQINENIYLDYSYCDNGFNIYHNSKIIDDICYVNYMYSETNNILVVSQDNGNDNIIFKNGTTKIIENFKLQGDYVEDFVNDKLYNYNGEELEYKCEIDFLYQGDNLYTCSSYSGTALLNKNLDVISNDYDSIFCYPDNKVCILKKDNLYGMYYNGDVLIEPIYYGMNVFDNAVSLNKMFGVDIYKFGTNENDKFLKKEDFVLNENTSYLEINVEDVIKEYYLEDYEDVINDYKTLFQKYSYVVLHNEQVNGFRKNLLMSFVSVADNYDYLEEYSLIDSLRNLSINKLDMLPVEGAGGLYYDYDLRIDLLNTDDNTVNHEIMHFIDYRINFKDNREVCFLDNRYYLDEEYSSLSVEQLENCETQYMYEYYNFIVEAGAEYYTSSYTLDHATHAYRNGLIVYGILNQLFGTDFMKSVYYSEYGDFQIYNKLLQYLTFEEYTTFLELTNRMVELDGGNLSDNDYALLVSYLIKLYNGANDTNWYDDEAFRFAIKSFVGIHDQNLSYTLSNSDIDKLNGALDIGFIACDELKLHYGSMSGLIGFIKDETGDYMIADVYSYNNSQYNGWLIINYDFNNKRTIEYNFIPYE